MYPEGMREQQEAQNDISHPFRMRLSFPTVPGIYASLQSLATISNPFGIMAAIVTTTKSDSNVEN
jgi:hypothetical protein